MRYVIGLCLTAAALIGAEVLRWFFAEVQLYERFTFTDALLCVLVVMVCLLLAHMTWRPGRQRRPARSPRGQRDAAGQLGGADATNEDPPILYPPERPADRLRRRREAAADRRRAHRTREVHPPASTSRRQPRPAPPRPRSLGPRNRSADTDTPPPNPRRRPSDPRGRR